MTLEGYVVKLKDYGACDVSDGLLHYCKIDDGGFFPDLIQRSGPHKTIVGPAYTVLFASVDDPRPEVNYIDNIPAGAFMIIALEKSLQEKPEQITQALYGGLMANRAQYQNSAGTIVFGRVRDLGEHKECGQPLFSLGVGTCAPKKAVKPVATNVSLPILLPNGCTSAISPGDVVVADENGVVRIPKDTLLESGDKLINYIEQQIAADTLVMEDIRNGIPAKQSQKDRRAALKQLL